jgi:hypothetical protein
MTHLDDNLLTALRAARPDTGDQPSASSPQATAMLTRILTAPESPTRRLTRRRLLLAGVPAVAATAAAVVLATTLTSPGPASNAVPTTASVRTGVLDAFQRASGDIFYSISTDRGAKGPEQTSRSWTYPAFPAKGQQVRYRLFTYLNGVPAEDTQSIYVQNFASGQSLSTNAGPRSAEIIDVQYATKTWSRQRSSAPIVDVRSSPSQIQEQVASGHFTVVGRGRVQGHEAIELTWTRSSSRLLFTWTMWVDAHSYTPLRATRTMQIRMRGGHDVMMNTWAAQYQLLPATPANLNLLNPPIPAGFHRVPRSPNF